MFGLPPRPHANSNHAIFAAAMMPGAVSTLDEEELDVGMMLHTSHTIDTNDSSQPQPQQPQPRTVNLEMGLMVDMDAAPHPRNSPRSRSNVRNDSSFNVFPDSLVQNDGVTVTHELPRLVLRNRAFHQSSNKIHIQHNKGVKIYQLLRHNWFHVFLRWPTRYSLLASMSVWTSSILFFAVIYIISDSVEDEGDCGLGIGEERIHFAAAFAFSLETCTTVGKYLLRRVTYCVLRTYE
jgi:hypothetical protein